MKIIPWSPPIIRVIFVKAYINIIRKLPSGLPRELPATKVRGISGMSQSFEETERVGGLIGETVISLIGNLFFEEGPKIRTERTEIPVDIRKYAPVSELEENVRRKTAEYILLKEKNASYLDVQNANLCMLGAEDMLGYAICMQSGKSVSLYDDENPAEISVFRIGNHIIAGIPGELFVEFALKIKAGAKADTTFVFELANGCLPGYCYNREALNEEGYEVCNSMLTPEFGDKIAEAVLACIGRLK